SSHAHSFLSSVLFLLFFLFNAPAPPDIYTLSLHDALPISQSLLFSLLKGGLARDSQAMCISLLAISYGAFELPKGSLPAFFGPRSEEHTSELQSRFDLVCRLLLEKKKKIIHHLITTISLLI